MDALPTDKDIGREVIYTPPRVRNPVRVKGVIKSLSKYGVFVQYDGHKGSTFTNRKDIEYA